MKLKPGSGCLLCHPARKQIAPIPWGHSRRRKVWHRNTWGYPPTTRV